MLEDINSKLSDVSRDLFDTNNCPFITECIAKVNGIVLLNVNVFTIMLIKRCEGVRVSERKTELIGPVRYSPLSQLHHCAVPRMGPAEQGTVECCSSPPLLVLGQK